jgi:3-oxoacyl-[acyl-carrier protein] reductase
MGNRLSGKVAIVTGAGRGIGRGIAAVFASEGARVVVVNRSEKFGTETVDKIRAAGGEAHFIQADISKKSNAEKMARSTVERYGKIDILCQNAGIFFPSQKIIDITEEDWDQINSVNLKGTFLTVQACLPQMISQLYGRILVTSSVTGPKTAIPGQAHYAASKAGINGFIRTAALEFARYNITVNGIEPGNILTETLMELGEDHVKGMEKSIPMGRLGKPEDIAYAMLFLASDEAEWITGITIVVDGGQILPESKFDIG